MYMETDSGYAIDVQACIGSQSSDLSNLSLLVQSMSCHLVLSAVYTAANISGGHLNPAVTVSTLACGFYPVSQHRAGDLLPSQLARPDALV